MANLWRQFQQLLPKSRLIVVTIQGHNGDGTSTATTTSGATLVVQGESVAIGQKAFVQDGRVAGAAPDLPVFEETV